MIAPERLIANVPRSAAPRPMAEEPLVFVTVGTDHHPFDRLVRWVDDWFLDVGRLHARALVQVGTSRPPRSVEWCDYLRAEEMQAALDQATVVVCHGGPSTVMQCRREGFRPIVVPRRHALGEHVDDHQVRFSTWLGRDPAFEVVGDDEGRFRGLLERAVVDSDAFHTTAPAPDVRASAKRFEQLVNGLFTVRLDRCG